MFPDGRGGLIPEVLMMSGVQLPDDRTLPLLDAHKRTSINDIKGRIRNIRVENGELVGDLDIDEGEADAARKVEKGYVDRMSVGYFALDSVPVETGKARTFEYDEEYDDDDEDEDDEDEKERKEDKNGNSDDTDPRKTGEDGVDLSVIPTRSKRKTRKRRLRVEGPAIVTTRWKPSEGSLVPIPADDDAKIRTAYINNLLLSESVSEQDVEALRRQMDETTKQETTAPAIDEKAIREQAVNEYKERCTAIRQECERAGVADIYNEVAETAKDLNDARAQIIDKISTRQQKPAHVIVKGDATQNRLTVTRDVLLHRALNLIKANGVDRPSVLDQHMPKGDFSRFDRFGYAEMGRFLLEGQGADLAYASNQEILERAFGFTSVYGLQTRDDGTAGGGLPINTMGTLPSIFADVANKTLAIAYQAAEYTFDVVGRKVDDARDLLDQNVMRISGVNSLDAWPSGEKPAEKPLTDARSRVKMVVYGNNISIGWHAILSDRLDFVSLIPAAMANAAKRRFNQEFWACFTGNQVMDEDNQQLFYSGHNNTFGSTLSDGVAVDSVSAGQQTLRLQTGLDGSIIGLKAAVLVAPSAKETQAKQLCLGNWSPEANTFERFNPFRGSIVPLVEVELDASSTTAFYLFPQQIYSAGAYCYLQGQSTPLIKSWIRADDNSLMMQVAQAGAVGAIDYRGVAKYVGS